MAQRGRTMAGRLFLLIVLLAALDAVTMSTASRASTSSCGSSNFQVWKGYDPSGHYLHGGRADIQFTGVPGLCTTSNYDDSSDWVMIAGSASSGPGGYAQIGFLHSNDSSITPNGNASFVEYTKDSSDPNAFYQLYYGYPGLGAQDTYSVDRFASDNKIHLRDNGYDYAVTPWDPENVWTDDVVYFSSEAQKQGNDVFGLLTDKVDFGNIAEKDTSNNWNSNAFNDNGNNACWFNTNVITSGVHYRAWTDPLNHSC
jgi:hypothetical protein